MHGLINRSIQCFLRDTYGQSVWIRVARDAGLGFDSFEAMLIYDRGVTQAVIDAASRVLARPAETVLEDLGHYLVSHPNVQSLRRLLRFGGVTFVDFLYSLEDLPGRGRLALPDLDLPAFSLTDSSGEYFSLTCLFPMPGAGHVIVGLLRAMADDYGALAFLEHDGTWPDGAEVITIHVSHQTYSEGRQFDLAARRAG